MSVPEVTMELGAEADVIIHERGNTGVYDINVLFLSTQNEYHYELYIPIEEKNIQFDITILRELWRQFSILESSLRDSESVDGRWGKEGIETYIELNGIPSEVVTGEPSQPIINPILTNNDIYVDMRTSNEPRLFGTNADRTLGGLDPLGLKRTYGPYGGLSTNNNNFGFSGFGTIDVMSNNNEINISKPSGNDAFNYNSTKGFGF